VSESTQFDKIYGSLLGLAMGDAVGFPAMYHRTIVIPTRRRNRLWDFSKLTDQYKINKISLPFTHALSERILDMSGTDDTEFAVVSAMMLMESGKEITRDSLLEGWKKYVVEDSDQVWSGISERASIENIKKGMSSPNSGNDNPHHYDDGAVARAVPIGLIHVGNPERAASIAEQMASITNAADGVYAAQAMAASISVACAGASSKEVVEAGIKYIPDDSWLGRKVKLAQDILEEAGGEGWAAIPGWNNDLVNSIYNYGNIAPETLAVAYAIFSSTQGKVKEGVQLATQLPKQADSMPAMVGALAGAMQGASSIPDKWKEALDQMKGICVPRVKGMSLKEVALQLSERN
jgi:ADP-ribosylglycohydrolase